MLYSPEIKPFHFPDSPGLLPNLLIIGAAKSGTTSLHKYLNQHPQIFMARRKEPRFFLLWENPERIALHHNEGRGEINFFCTLDRYKALFLNGKDHAIRGESSTAYLANPECAGRIKKLIPGVKIIALLRNPVTRAFSNYLIYKNWRMEKKSFEDAIDEEIKTGRHNYQQPMQYLHLGKYVDSLKIYYKLFPAEQIKIYLYDDLVADSQSLMQNIFEYLGVDPLFKADIERKYNNSYIRRYATRPRIDNMMYYFQRGFRKFKINGIEERIKRHRFYRPEIKPETRQKLINYYADEISALESLLNKDLSAWRK